MLPPGNRRRVFHWEKYRRSAGDSCIANEPPENYCCFNAENLNYDCSFQHKTDAKPTNHIKIFIFQTCLENIVLVINLVRLCLLSASQLGDLILHVHNNTDCPCSPQICRRAPGGYCIGPIYYICLDPNSRY